MTKNRLYLILALACLVGYGWLFYALRHPGSPFTLCYWKMLTGVPCPSCGSTRSIICLAHGDVSGALRMNPLGIISAGIMLLVPLGLIYDTLFSKSMIFNAFNWCIRNVQRRWVAAILIVLVAANWAWNIFKHI